MHIQNHPRTKLNPSWPYPRNSPLSKPLFHPYRGYYPFPSFSFFHLAYRLVRAFLDLLDLLLLLLRGLRWIVWLLPVSSEAQARDVPSRRRGEEDCVEVFQGEGRKVGRDGKETGRAGVVCHGGVVFVGDLKRNWRWKTGCKLDLR